MYKIHPSADVQTAQIGKDTVVRVQKLEIIVI